jgi:hypothetical protein
MVGSAQNGCSLLSTVSGGVDDAGRTDEATVCAAEADEVTARAAEEATVSGASVEAGPMDEIVSGELVVIDDAIVQRVGVHAKELGEGHVELAEFYG